MDSFGPDVLERLPAMCYYAERGPAVEAILMVVIGVISVVMIITASAAVATGYICSLQDTSGTSDSFTIKINRRKAVVRLNCQIEPTPRKKRARPLYQLHIKLGG